MTRYTVVWSPQAENQLAQIWVEHATGRAAITNATRAIDTALAVDPATKGTALHEGLRALDITPLHVLFSVEELDRLVRVARVCYRLPPPLPAQVNGAIQSPNG